MVLRSLTGRHSTQSVDVTSGTLGARAAVDVKPCLLLSYLVKIAQI